MSCKIEFTSRVGENDVWVEATYTPGQPERGPSLSGPGEPAEGPEVEINRVYIEHSHEQISERQLEALGQVGARIKIDLDIEGLFTRTAPSRERVVYLYQSVEERLTEAAFAHVAES